MVDNSIPKNKNVLNYTNEDYISKVDSVFRKQSNKQKY